MHTIQTILVPFDFSAQSRAALEVATDLAQQLGGAQLHLLHVLSPPSYMYASEIHTGGLIDGVLSGAERDLESVANGIPNPPGHVETHVAEGGTVAETIDSVADRLHADLIVMGTHGRTGISHALLGSVTERALRRAPCPVMTVRSKEAIARDEAHSVVEQPGVFASA